MTGNELRSIRVKVGLTQHEMGKELGVNNETICRWERRNLPLGKLVSDAALRLLETHSQKQRNIVNEFSAAEGESPN